MRLMSLVKPSFSHAFLNRLNICSAVSLPRDFTLIIQGSFQRSHLGSSGVFRAATTRDTRQRVHIRPNLTPWNHTVYRPGPILQVGRFCSLEPGKCMSRMSDLPYRRAADA